MKAEIQETGFATRRTCVLCGEWTEKEVLLTKLTEDNHLTINPVVRLPLTNNYGWVCDEGVMVGPEEAGKRAIDHWEERKRMAEANLTELHRIRDGETTLELPTAEALEAARQADEWYGPDYKLPKRAT